ncbi:cytochrome P450 716A67-like [Neltuma alba]|uniref:cytochrome P450 716A67-like n=1 Tax=Neltuma alba TaxID=207710 RepID=UPI0010A30026|nr:cytochrome P450 716A67-like [Prosopis alba]
MNEASGITSVVVAVAVMAVIGGGWWVWKMAKWVWVDPKKMERRLRKQGLKADPYRFWVGDVTRMMKMQKEAISSPLPPHCHDLVPRVFSFGHHLVNKHGENPFMWFGPTPRLILTDPELIKNVFNRNYDFVKLHTISIDKYVSVGVASYNGDKWANHRKIINPAFSVEKLKTLIPIFSRSCNDMMNKWESLLSPTDGTCEVDVWPWLRDFTKDVISRAAFGSSYEEGEQIFDLLSEQAELVANNLQKHRIPLGRFLTTKENKRMKENERNMEASLECIINKKKEAMKAGQATKDDLLGILLESNLKEIEEQGNDKNVGLSMKDVIGECKLFYLAGQETISSLLVWTMMLLSMYPNWQARAREEVLQVFGNQKPDFDALSRLKIVTMILYEALRLYPPIAWVERYAEKDVKLGNLSIPKGVRISLQILMMHHDERFWGDDAKEFKPGRFSEGISNAAKGNSVAFFPFAGGPRVCIGQNFALLEAKTAMSLILQRFSFELSPTYSHAPTTVLTLQPKHGVQVILHKL